MYLIHFYFHNLLPQSKTFHQERSMTTAKYSMWAMCPPPPLRHRCCCDSPHVQNLSAGQVRAAQSADDRWKSRAAALEWKWHGLDNMATTRFKRLHSSDGLAGKRCCPDASLRLQLKCSFHEPGLSITGGELWGGVGGRAIFGLLFFCPSCDPQGSCCGRDNGRWECVDIKEAHCLHGHAMQKCNSVTLLLRLLLCNVCVRFPPVNPSE